MVMTNFILIINEKDNFIFQCNFISELQYLGKTLLPFSSEIYLKKQTKYILQLYKNTKKFSTRNNNKKLQYLQK